jgi:hypothetical protein
MVTGTQRLRLHISSAAHWVHAKPPVPQALFAPPPWQAPLSSQQPVQFVGLQGC